MDLFNVTAKITLDTSGYDKGVDDIKKKTQEVGSSTEKNIKTIATNAYVQLAQTVVNVAGKIKDLTLDLINYADRYGDLSAKYDISSQSLQEFEYIASQNGATLDELLSTMTMMYNRAKENADVFDQLGVSVTDTNGNMKSMDTLFWEVKTALDGVENSGDKSALMLEAFGRNAMSVGEFLRKDTGELKALAQQANDLGIVMDTGVIDKAGAFNDKLDELKLRAKSAFAELMLGADGAEEKFDNLMDDLLVIVDNALPQIAKAGEKFGGAFMKGLGKAFVNRLKSMLTDGWGRMIGKGWLWGEGSWTGWGDNSNSNNTSVSDTDIVDMNSYEINERQSQTMEIKLTADGTTPLDQQNVEKIAQSIVPYIDKALGGV